MKTNRFAAAAFLALAALWACSNDSISPGMGAIAVQLTDAPFPTDSVKSVDIFVLRVDGRMAEADSGTAATATTTDSSKNAGWTTLASPAASIDLLTLTNGKTMAIGQTPVVAGTYRGFRLVIDPSKSSVTLKNGTKLTSTSSPSVSFPSAGTSGIKINLSGPITVADKDTTKMVVDFDVENSFVMRGNSISQQGLTFKPVVKASVAK
jgi:hypothetical protein